MVNFIQQWLLVKLVVVLRNWQVILEVKMYYIDYMLRSIIEEKEICETDDLVIRFMEWVWQPHKTRHINYVKNNS